MLHIRDKHFPKSCKKGLGAGLTTSHRKLSAESLNELGKHDTSSLAAQAFEVGFTGVLAIITADAKALGFEAPLEGEGLRWTDLYRWK